jgi:multicomponent Na+:H+ antiporter subunit G
MTGGAVVVEVLLAVSLLVGLALMTLGVAGMLRRPDLPGRTQVAGSLTPLGAIAVMVAVALGGDLASATRAILTAAFLLITGPVSANAIMEAAHRREEPRDPPGQ